jgi:Membrane-associated sensor, integral membrane domain
MVKTQAAAPEVQAFTISSLPPSPAQRRLALGVVLALMAAFVVAAGPLSTVPLARIDAFVPMYVAAMFVSDGITAVLLFAQFAILRSHALLAIASGYLFTALIVIPYGLTFPGAFAPEGLLGAGLQSPAWLYFLWHVGFPLFVIAYALLKNADPSKQRWKGTLTTAILLSAAVVVAAVCAATLLVTAGHALLPRVLRDTVSSVGPLYQYSAARTVLVNAVVALMVLWIRRGSVLDLWLMVVLCDYVIEISLFMIPVVANRYSFGWYAGRFFGLISGTLVLFVLLYEITTLYARLVNAILAQRREREARLMTGDAVSASIAHEVNLPPTTVSELADVAAAVLCDVDLIAVVDRLHRREGDAYFGPQPSQDDLFSTGRLDRGHEVLIIPGIADRGPGGRRANARRRHGHAEAADRHHAFEDPLRRVRNRCRVCVHDGAQGAGDSIPRVRDPLAREAPVGHSQARRMAHESLSVVPRRRPAGRRRLQLARRPVSGPSGGRADRPARHPAR